MCELVEHKRAFTYKLYINNSENTEQPHVSRFRKHYPQEFYLIIFTFHHVQIEKISSRTLSSSEGILLEEENVLVK